MFGRAPKKSFFPHSVKQQCGRITPSRSNIGDIMMHGININEKIKARCQIVLALSLFCSI